MRSRSILLVLMTVLALVGRRARAADKPIADKPIELRIPDCPSAPFSIDAFLSSLKVELAGRTPPCCALSAPTDERRETAAGLQVTLSIEPCDPGTEEVEIRIHDSGRAEAATRQIALRDIPADARPRALALAVAELVRTVSQQIPSAVPPAPSPAPVGGDGASGPSDRRLILSAVLEVRTHPDRNMTLWGVRPGVGLVRDRWQAAIELETVSGDPSVPLGDVNTHLLALAVELGPRFRLRHLALDLGGSATLGWAWMGGHTSDPNNSAGSGSALVASAGVRLGIDLPALVHRANFRVLVEGGAMLHGVEATVNDRRVTGLTGAYLIAGLGVEVDRRR